MTTIGGSGISDNYGGGSGGGIPDAPSDGKAYARKDAGWTEITGDGPLLSSDFDIPADFPTVTDAFAYIDAHGGVANGNIVNLWLPDTGNTPLTDTFDFLDRDYSGVRLIGAPPSSTMITGWSAITGSAGNWSFTFTVQDPIILSNAAEAGYVMMETGYAASNEDRSKIIGFWEVTAIDGGAGSITVRLTSQDATMGTPTFSANIWRATVFTTMFKVADSSVPWMKLQRSKSPILSNIGIVGAYGDAGYVEVPEHTGILALAGSVVASDEDGTVALTEQGHFVGICGFTYGVYCLGSTSLSGTYCVSRNARSGVVALGNSQGSIAQMTSSGNGQHGLLAYTGGELVFGGYTSLTQRASVFAGNGQNGILADYDGSVILMYGAVGGNAGTDVVAQNMSTIGLGSASSLMFLGTTSPAVNTVGNSNSYIRRP